MKEALAQSEELYFLVLAGQEKGVKISEDLIDKAMIIR